MLLAWVGVLVCCIVVTTFYTVSWGICDTPEIEWQNGVIDFYPVHFLFPKGKLSQLILVKPLMISTADTQKVNMRVEGQERIKLFCIDFVQRAEVTWTVPDSMSFHL